jgi:uncharacterized membrane protein
MNRPSIAVGVGAAVWCAAIVAAPLFHLTFIYDFFSLICHQQPSRSWNLYGEPLAVCIRCSSIYFGFLAALIASLRPDARLFRIAVAASFVEFAVAFFLIDSVVLRIVSGTALGASAAPFVRTGVAELLRQRA